MLSLSKHERIILEVPLKERITWADAAADNLPMIPFQPMRAPWGNFPDVVIQAEESLVKKHLDYQAAKRGDVDAAMSLVGSVLTTEAVNAIRSQLGRTRPILVAVHAVEENSVNVIPLAYAEELSRRLSLPVDENIIQSNRVGHTGSGGWQRMALQATFAGQVEKGKNYLLVDDFVGQGGTLANLRGYIESNDGRADLATTLTGKGYSAKLILTKDTLERLRERHGDIENWWRKVFGHGFELLTESEARYLERAENADTIRNRILAAAQGGNP